MWYISTALGLGGESSWTSEAKARAENFEFLRFSEFMLRSVLPLGYIIVGSDPPNTKRVENRTSEDRSLTVKPRCSSEP